MKVVPPHFLILIKYFVGGDTLKLILKNFSIYWQFCLQQWLWRLLDTDFLFPLSSYTHKLDLHCKEELYLLCSIISVRTQRYLILWAILCNNLVAQFVQFGDWELQIGCYILSSCPHYFLSTFFSCNIKTFLAKLVPSLP